eukprot:3230472-Amphidinium_carterae.1
MGVPTGSAWSACRPEAYTSRMGWCGGCPPTGFCAEPALKCSGFCHEVYALQCRCEALNSLALGVGAVYGQTRLSFLECGLYLGWRDCACCNACCFLNGQLPQSILIVADFLPAALDKGLVKQDGQLVKLVADALHVLHEGLPWAVGITTHPGGVGGIDRGVRCPVRAVTCG